MPGNNYTFWCISCQAIIAPLWYNTACMKTNFKRSMKVAITCAMSISLAFLLIFAINLKSGKVQAFGDEKTVNSYKEAKAFLTTVKSEYNAIMKQANSIYSAIEDITTQAFEAQSELTAARLKFNDLAKYQYTNSVQFSIISALLQSTSMDDFFKNLEYADTVMDYEYSIAKEQADKKAAFDSKLEELNSQTAAQNECLAQASGKLAQANEVLQSIRSKLTPEELKELEGEIEDIGGGGDTPTPGPTPPQPTPPGPQPDPPSPSWSTGLASAYGGSTDPSTGPESRTATGEICNDWSTGCAVPMA